MQLSLRLRVIAVRSCKSCSGRRHLLRAEMGEREKILVQLYKAMGNTISNSIRTIFSAVIVIAAAMSAVALGNAEPAIQSKSQIAEAEQLLAELGYMTENADGRLDFMSRHAVMAFQKVQGLKRTGVLTASLLEKMRTAITPEAKYGGAAHIEVDLTRQVLFMVGDDGKVDLIVPISSGNGEKYWDKTTQKFEVASTPRGEFKIQRKVNGTRKAPLGSIYYPSYFLRGWAVHGSPSIPPKPASHGCVRVPRGADKLLFKQMPIGMSIYLYD